MFFQLERYIKNLNLQKFNSMENAMIADCNYTYRQIRDILIRNGKIIDESETEQIYVFLIQSGKLGNEAIVALGVRESNVYMKAFAKEGFFRQETCKRAMSIMKEVLK